MSSLKEIFAGRANIDFRPKWRISLTVSAALLAVSALLLLILGLNLSIDFRGGGLWEVPVADDVTVADARSVHPDLADAKIQLVEEPTAGTFVRVQVDNESLEDAAGIRNALAELGGVSSDDVVESTIGPTWGDRITNQALRALGFFVVAVALYLAWRLEWRMAIGALAAVVHDLVITAGVYALLRFEVSPATVIALLTILGYSLYDTVVVYDKVLENQNTPIGEKMAPYDLVNQSMNQVLVRSINTTITTILPVVSMLIIGWLLLGGVTLRDFALALFIGLILGTYSSIFVAAPLLAWMRSMEPEARRTAQAEARRSDRKGEDGDERFNVVDDRDVKLIAPGGSQPRGRKKGRKR